MTAIKPVFAAAALLAATIATPAHAAKLSASCPTPEYASAWVNDDVQGDVELAFLVEPDGNILDAKILKSSGSSKLDKASLAGGSRCKFGPRAADSGHAPVWTKIRYSWEIEQA
ncbi:energy transducer TonB [Massilia glaciei]|uniref:TonB family protein n=1 Tax=Massilia glaciei TaxID=1524097 RepID=A0A2U2HPF6_9BURK|nr:energy transducer TonB [Massilia glaciei]PWF49342.1 TonB family protein [Massilia glaciei]